MASVSGSGRKILHERLRDQPPRPSPYARSPPLALPPPPPPAGSPRWLLGLVSGAGKLISSVFRADRSSPDSSDYSSDQDSSSSRSDEQNVDAPKQLHGSRRELKKSEMEVSHAIVPVSETKLAIEKLLQQETFSRDECERLTKLLQSRVVDSPSVFVQDKVGEAISNGLPGNTGDFSGAWLSLQQCNVLPESDVHDDAPVDLAKSYMQSLPPQQSPSVGSITLSSMIASKEDLQTDSSNHARTSNSLSSIKDVGKPSSTVLEDIINDDAPHESSVSASASKVPDDAKSQDQNLCSLHATDGSGNEFSRNGGSTESNVNPQLVSQENKSFTQFSNGEQTTDVAKVTKEHPSMDTAPAHGENHITTKSPKVAKRKSIEHVSVSPRPRTRQHVSVSPRPRTRQHVSVSPRPRTRQHVSVSPRPRTRQQVTREGKVVREREQRHRQGRVSK